MERAFQEDFSRVRLEEGATAPAAGAVAFARGDAIHFAPGAFEPTSAAGRGLLGHELAHVVQQRRGTVRQTHRLGGLALNADHTLERQADLAGRRAARGQAAFGPAPAPDSAAGGADGAGPSAASTLATAPRAARPAAAPSPVAQGMWGAQTVRSGLSSLSAWGAWGVSQVRELRIPAAVRNNPALRALYDTDPQLAVDLSQRQDDEAAWLTHLAGRDPDLRDARGRADVARPDAAQLGFRPELHLPVVPQNVAPRLHELATANHPMVRTSADGQTLHVGYNLQQLNEMHRGIVGELYGESGQQHQAQQNWQPFPTVEAAFGDRDAGTRRQRERLDLLSQAYRRTNAFNYATYDNRVTNNDLSNFGQVSQEAPENAAAHLLNRHGQEGFTIGEEHNESASKGYLIDNMGSLADSGVNTLYLEHIRSEYQDLVDQYLGSGPGVGMPDELRSMVRANDEAHELADHPDNHNLAGVLAAAKIHGMRVRGIDSMAAQSIPAGPDGHDLRAITMNVFGENVVRADAQNRNNGKYVMLAGRAHNTTHARNNPPNVGFQKGLPGFSQLLEIPAVRVDPLTGRLRLDREKRRKRY